MKQTIFFDLGNVLIFFSREKMFKQLAACTGLPLPIIQSYIIKHFDSYESGMQSSEEIYRGLLAHCKKAPNCTFSNVMEALADIFTPNIELFPLVEELKRQGSKLVLISNTNECHYHYAKKHYPILNLFDVNILSYEVGACKPNPKIFGRALKEVKGKSFYTDDIPAFVKAGREAGLDAELFTDVPNLIHHLVQRRLLHENNVRF